MIKSESLLCLCKGSLLLASCLWPSSLVGQQNEPSNREANSPPVASNAKIVAATVSDGVALITRELDVPVNAKSSVFDFGTLPRSVILDSIHAQTSPGVILESLLIREKGKEQRELQLATLEKEHNRLEQEQLELEASVTVIDQQIALIDRAVDLSKAPVANDSQRVSIDGQSLKSILEFSLDKQSTLSQEKQKHARRLAEIETLVGSIDDQIRELGYPGSHQFEVQATIRNETKLPQKIQLNYFVKNSNWSPNYELHYNSENQTFRLRLIAKVVQETGEDWTNVKLHLTNDSLRRHDQKPTLVPLQVQSSTPSDATSGLSANDRTGPRKQSANDNELADEIRAKWTDMASGNSNSERNRRAVLLQESELKNQPQRLALLADDGHDSLGDFSIRMNRPTTILSLSQEQSVEVSNVAMDGSLIHTATPLLSSFAYREVEFKTGSSQSLLEGSVRVYENNRLIGRSRLRSIQSGQPFSMGIGPDAKVRVRRELVNKNRETQGGNVRAEQEIKLVVANYHDYPIRVQLFDRIPFSNDQQNAAVEYSALSPALSNDPLYRRTLFPRNILRWDLDIPATRFGANAFDHNYAFHVVHEKSSELNVAFRQASGDLQELDELLDDLDTMSGGGGMGGGMGGMMRIGQ
ncbi:MAG: mucoidy inhibitor MuiA family protein [Pirellula sp.]|jgi:uncharacterized protein (TIGR02231 family)|nr:mucoidy inhibitor MuiA family protein [Pirellula sp.]